MEVAKKLANMSGGGTACSSAINHLLERDELPASVILISDHESWQDWQRWSSALSSAWVKYKERKPEAKLWLADLNPSITVDGDGEDVHLISGLTSTVLAQIAWTSAGGTLVSQVEAVDLDKAVGTL